MPPTMLLPPGTAPLSSDLVIPFLPAPPRRPVECDGYVVEAMLESLREDAAAQVSQ